jgi:hypothetical protein
VPVRQAASLLQIAEFGVVWLKGAARRGKF